MNLKQITYQVCHYWFHVFTFLEGKSSLFETIDYLHRKTDESSIGENLKVSSAYFTLKKKKLIKIYAKSNFQFVSSISWIEMADQLPSFDAEAAFGPYLVNTPVRTAFSLIFNLHDDHAQIVSKQRITVLLCTAIGSSLTIVKVDLCAFSNCFTMKSSV